MREWASALRGEGASKTCMTGWVVECCLMQLRWNLPSFSSNKVNEYLMNSSGFLSLAIILSPLIDVFRSRGTNRDIIKY